MTEHEKNQKLKELSESIDEIERFLAKYNAESDDEDFEDDDITCEELDDDDGDGVGYGFGFNLDKLFDTKYNEHILSEPDEDGMVEISDELYDRLFGKYHSKEDMLTDVISELDCYISGKYVGYEGYWSKVHHLGINKESNRPRIAQDEELKKEECEYDLYDVTEFEKCYWTNVDDEYADIFEYELIDDSPIRELIDKYYPELEW